MWWNNTVTKAGTEEPGGILAATSTLYRELELLEGAQEVLFVMKTSGERSTTWNGMRGEML